MSRIYVLIFAFAIVSCKESKGFDEANLIKPGDIGEYYKLEKDNIKIFLPKGFRELSEEETKIYIDSIKEEKLRYYYQKNL